MSKLCEECGLPIPACNRIAMLERQVKDLARSVLQLSRESARTWDYDGETQISSGVDLDRETQIQSILD